MTPTEPAAGAAGGGLTLRPASLEDADRVAELYAGARRAAVPAMPPPVPTEAEDRVRFAGVLAGTAEVWLAEEGPQQPVLQGFMVLEEGWLDALYVRPDLTGHGIGTALLDLAKALRPEGFGLSVFESNQPARRFYDRRGLVAVRRTDGSANEERAPEVMMVWPGADPVATLRGAIDDLDADLARLLELRAGLTRAVQDHKAADRGAAAAVPRDPDRPAAAAVPRDPDRTAAAVPRDPDREAEIVARMAPLAPRLGPARLARIMHTVITESLEAP